MGVTTLSSIPPESTFLSNTEPIVRMTTFEGLKRGEWLLRTRDGKLAFGTLQETSGDPRERTAGHWQIHCFGPTVIKSGAENYHYTIQRIHPVDDIMRVLQYCGGTTVCMAPLRTDHDQELAIRFINTKEDSLFKPIDFGVIQLPPALPEEVRNYPVANLVALRGSNKVDLRLFISVLEANRLELRAIGYPSGPIREDKSGPMLGTHNALWVFQAVR